MYRHATTLLLAGALLAAPLAAQEAQLKSGDAKKIGKPIGDWIEAKIENDFEKLAEAKDALYEAVEDVNKKLKDQDVLAMIDDWEILLDSSRDYATAGEFIKKGKVESHEFLGTDYAAWVPSKYNPKKSSYPTVLLLTDAERGPAIEALPEELREQFLIVAPSLDGVGSTELDTMYRSQLRMLGTAVQGAMHFRVDRDRLFVIGQGEAGVAVASDLAALFPHFFAGVATVGAPVAASAGKTNLELLHSAGDHADLAAALGWCLEAGERAKYPASFSFELVREWAGRAFWVQALNFDVAADGEPTNKMTVSVDRATNTITIDTTGVYSLRIFLNDKIVDLDQEVTIIRNGSTYKGTFSRTLGALTESFEGAFDTGDIYTARLAQLDVPVEEKAEGGEGN